MTNHRTTGDEAIQSGLHGHLVTAHPAGCNAPHRVHRAFILNQKPNDLSAEGMFPKGGQNHANLRIAHQRLHGGMEIQENSHSPLRCDQGGLRNPHLPCSDPPWAD